MQQQSPSHNDRFMTIAEACKRTSLSRWTLNRLADFPKKVRLTSGRSAYRASEVEAWMASRASQKQGEAA